MALHRFPLTAYKTAADLIICQFSWKNRLFIETVWNPVLHKNFNCYLCGFSSTTNRFAWHYDYNDC